MFVDKIKHFDYNVTTLPILRTRHSSIKQRQKININVREIIFNYHMCMSVTRNQELKVSGNPNSVTDQTKTLRFFKCNTALTEVTKTK